MPTSSRLALAWPRRRQPADDDRRIQLLGPDHFGRESAALESRDSCLVPGCGWSRPAGAHVARANVSRQTQFVGAHRDRLRRRPAQSVARRGELLVASARSSRWGHRARWQAAGRPDQSVTAEVARRGHPVLRQPEERDRQGSVWRIARRPDRYRWRTARHPAAPRTTRARAQPNRNTARRSRDAAERVAAHGGAAARSAGAARIHRVRLQSAARRTPPTRQSAPVAYRSPAAGPYLRVRAVWWPWSAIPLPRLRRIHSQPAEAVRQAPGGQAPLAAPAQSSFSCSARNFSNSAPISSALGTRSGRSA